MTYQVSVRRKLIAQHYLIGGDWGRENVLHSHVYSVEIRVDGETLDRHGYLVDIVEIEAGLQSVVERYADRTLNELPEFADLNPSLEHFARIIHERMRALLALPESASLTVRLWESDDAWASYRA
jgi:6-pyruvoyltetrahydropterin/6-carboxytetrahydropterin synthase